MNHAFVTSLVAASVAASAAQAELFEVEIVGTVDFGTLNSGAFAGMQSGDPASMTFQVDSETGVDGPPDPFFGNIARRGYDVVASTFELTVNGATVGLADPYPAGNIASFVIRNDDPGVDGFYLSSLPGFGADDGVWIDYPAILAPDFKALFGATYGGDTLDSLDIADAVGTYDFTGLTVFNWGLSDAGIQPVGFIFDSFSISQVPAPAASLLAFAPLAAARRRR